MICFPLGCMRKSRTFISTWYLVFKNILPDYKLWIGYENPYWLFIRQPELKYSAVFVPVYIYLPGKLLKSLKKIVKFLKKKKATFAIVECLALVQKLKET